MVTDVGEVLLDTLIAGDSYGEAMSMMPPFARLLCCCPLVFLWQVPMFEIHKLPFCCFVMRVDTNARFVTVCLRQLLQISTAAAALNNGLIPAKRYL